MKTIMKASRLYVMMILYRTSDSIMELFLQTSGGGATHVHEMDTVPQPDKNYEILKLRNFEFRLYKHIFEDEVFFKIQVPAEIGNTLKLLLHNHVLSLFKNTPEIFHETESNVDLTTIYVFENATQFILAGEDLVTADFTEQFFSKCENLEGAIVEPVVDNELSENSKLTTAKNLYFEHAFEQVEIIALHFKGHHAVFEDSECCNRTVEKIIRQWIANEAFQELKSMKIKQASGWFLSPQFFHHYIESERYEPSRRPENYENKTKIIDYEFEPFKCADFVDIQRKFDGKWASFKVTTECFEFCVWD